MINLWSWVFQRFDTLVVRSTDSKVCERWLTERLKMTEREPEKARETPNLKTEISIPMHAMLLDLTIVKAGRVPMKTMRGQASTLNGSW
jgi:hypothetical protein